MELVSLLLAGVGAPAATLLLKWWIQAGDATTTANDLSGDVSKALVSIASDKINNVLIQHRARREFENLGEKVTSMLLPLFEEAMKRGECNAEMVVDELKVTLGSVLPAGIFVRENLDPAKVAAELRRLHNINVEQFSAAEFELYEMALNQAVRHLVNIAAALPEFNVEFAKECLERLSRMGRDFDRVVETVQRIEKAVAKDSITADSRYEADYRQAVIRKLDYLELFGADIPPEARRHSLSVAYVSLSLQSRKATVKQLTLLPVKTVLDELTPRAGRLLIRGEAGSGKSTLFRWVAIRAAGAMQGADSSVANADTSGAINSASGMSFRVDERSPNSGDATYWANRIPFLIRLREFPDGQLPAPEMFPVLIAKEIGNPPPRWVLTVLEAGRAIILLDGIDEVPTTNRETLRGEIRAFIDAYPTNYYLVSTRPQAVGEDWLAGEQFNSGTVNPMNDRDKAELIDKWHEAVADELHRRGEYDPQLSGMGERLKAKLRTTPWINLLAKYPLLASMICAFHRRNNENLPSSEVELVERLCFMLLDDRDRLSGLRRKGALDDYSSLEYRHKKMIVQDLAYHMLVHKSESSIDQNDALTEVRSRLERLSKSATPKEILTAIIERSGMLQEPATGRIGFLHNTFKEYLTALRLVEQNADGLLARNWNQAEWLHVILFAAGTEKHGFATNLITKILEPAAEPIKRATRFHKPTADERNIRQRQVLALRCGAVALDLDPELRKLLDQQRAALFPPQTLTDAEALAAVGDLAVEELQWREGLTEKERVGCVRALRLIGTPKSKKELRGYFGDLSLAVIDELAQEVSLLDILSVQQLVIEGSLLDIPLVQRLVQEHPTYRIDGDLKHLLHAIVDLSPLAGKIEITVLNLGETHVSDLRPIADLQNLTSLKLHKTKVTDLSPLASMKKLKTLDLSLTPVIDLSPLADLTELTSLDIRITRVHDLSPLVNLHGLRKLFVSDPPSCVVPASLRNIVTRD